MIGFRSDIVKRTDYLFLTLLLSLLITNLVLISLPLTKYFSYEYSVVNGFIISLLSAIITVGSWRKMHEKFELRKYLKTLGLKLLFFIILPFFVALINSFNVRYCPFSDGIPFYLVIILPSIFIGLGIAGFSILVNEKYAYLIATAVTILILLIPVWELSLNPQVFFFNPIIAYFPGNIYDEGISVDNKLCLYRLLNLLFFGLIFTIGTLSKRERIKKNKKYLISIISVTALLFIFISPYFGLSTTNSSLRKELNKSIETPNFKIYYSGNKDIIELKYIVGLHEYYYTELSDFFDSKPEKIIVSYIFRNRGQKQKLLGAGNADVAKPWLYQIYISEESIGATLKHELAHIFTADFGKYYFKVADKFNPALIEGVASAADNLYDEYEIHFLAALAYKNNYKYPIPELFEGFNFFSRSSGLSYVYAGSFTSFLIEKYGIGKIKELYRNLDYNLIFNKSIHDLDREYILFLQEIKIEDNIAASNYYFGRKSLLQKACPRFLANETSKLYQLLMQKSYIEALEQANKLEILGSNYTVALAKAIALEKLDSLDQSIEYLKIQIEKFSDTAYEYNLLVKLADNLVIANKPDSAKSIYENIVDDNPNHRLVNVSLIRLELMNRDSQLMNYISGNEKEKYEILAELNKKRLFFPSVPVLIGLHLNLNLNYRDLLPFVADLMKVDSNYGFYAALKMSEYSLNNLDFENALKFVKIAKNSGDDFVFKRLVESHEKKINWFIKYSNFIKIKGLSG